MPYGLVGTPRGAQRCAVCGHQRMRHRRGAGHCSDTLMGVSPFTADKGVRRPMPCQCAGFTYTEGS